ncbi:aminotransferase class V-fold PLP-dependent enzyme [Sinomonas sp. ASV322]|uniref:kynureninase n=1 Tax=Sinomonas sp. ASV322 TaxID=3041920 RepID=UPI0027DC1EA3|nr:aminotransferase class V-fold PLP-dependent enzyme [Sinomonas sp. ASV322]MDQ4504544.1 aminotransferase class V-fold PLP-dependent enzyme [Sinomonas sp. ASV322]
MTQPSSGLMQLAHQLDAADPLSEHRAAFAPAPGVSVYLDGNSLGRPLRTTPDRIADFVRHDWGTRLIRSWDEQWMDLPAALGDRIARIALGADTGQTIVADSTTVLIYKLIRAAVDVDRSRRELVIEAGNFPTDRFVAEGIAAECGLTIRWLTPDEVHGVTVDEVAAAVSEQTALVALSHVDYRSGALADMPAITDVVKRSGALMFWDLCHSVGVIPLQLDEWGVDLAVGCTYKYLNGGPGSPAFAYVRSGLQPAIRQPIQGWMGAGDVFAMAPAYAPAAGIRQLLSGTPPVLGMVAMGGMLDLIEAAGIDRIRAKSHSLTGLVVRAYDDELAPLGVRLLSPRDADRRGSHVSVGHEHFAEVTHQLWQSGVIPDFRFPDGIRIGLSPLSTSHTEALEGVLAIRDALRTHAG